MATTQPTADTTLRLQRTYKAPAAKVFEAWTRPDVMKKWFAPSADYAIPSCETDLKVGGKYRVVMKHKDGNEHVAVGTYKEIDPARKLVFTWSWEGGEMLAPESTLVTIELAEKGGATELTLTHELFPNAELRDKHMEGWTGCLSRLPEAV